MKEDIGLYKKLYGETISEVSEKLEETKKTYDVGYMSYSIDFSKKDSTPMIKQIFLDDESHVLAINYLCLNHEGYASKKANEALLSMFKDIDDYIELCSMPGGRNVENTYLLLTHADADKIFNKIVSVSLAQNENNPQFMSVTSWEYEDGND